MLVVDTNVWVYAVGTEHPLRAPAQALLAAAADDRVRLTTTPEVVQEFLHVRAARTSRRQATRDAADVARLCAPLLVARDDDVHEALALFGRHDDLNAFDALLAATAIGHEADAVVSADRAFRRIRALRWLDLSGLDPDRLVENLRGKRRF